MPWRNGGGVTHEIAVHPEGAGLDGFDWRVSMAEVAADGPFSRFDGIDRSLAVLEGTGIRLCMSDGAEIVADATAGPAHFAGEAAIMGHLIAGSILDLNVMTRRGEWVHRLRSIGLRGCRSIAFDAPIVALVCRDGALSLSGLDLTLGPRDCLLLTRGPREIEAEGEGCVLAAEILPQ